MDRYGGKVTVRIHGIGDPEDVQRHVEDIHEDGDLIEFSTDGDALVLTLEQGGNTAALGALGSILRSLDEALDPCTHPGKVRITAEAEPVLDTWKPKGAAA